MRVVCLSKDQCTSISTRGSRHGVSELLFIGILALLFLRRNIKSMDDECGKEMFVDWKKAVGHRCESLGIDDKVYTSPHESLLSNRCKHTE